MSERMSEDRFGELRSILNARHGEAWKWARILQTVDHSGRAEPEEIIAYLVSSVSQWEDGMRPAPPRWLGGMGDAKRGELFALVNQVTLSALRGAPNMLLGQKLSRASHIKRIDVHTPMMPMRHIVTQALSGEAEKHLEALVCMTRVLSPSQLLPLLSRFRALEALVLRQPKLGKGASLGTLSGKRPPPRLKHLRFGNLAADGSDAKIFAALAPTLETLALETPADPDITPAHLLRSVDTSRLTALDLGDVPLGDGDLDRLAKQKSLANLERAILCSGRYLDGLFDVMPSLTRLRLLLRERDLRDAPWREFVGGGLETLEIRTEQGQHLSPAALGLLDATTLRHLSLETSELTSAMLDHIEQAPSRDLESFSLATSFEDASELQTIFSWANRQPNLTSLSLPHTGNAKPAHITANDVDAIPHDLHALDLTGHNMSPEAIEALLTHHKNLRALTLGLEPADTTWLHKATERGLFDTLEVLDLTIEHLDMDVPATLIPTMRRRPLAWFALRNELLDREERAFGKAYDRCRFTHGLLAPMFSCWHACSG